MNDYFIKIYDTGKTAFTDIKHFSNEEKLWEWVEANRDTLFVAYKGEVLADMS